MLHLLLPVIVFIGVVTSYEDMKFGRIRNQWIFFGFFYAFIIYLYFIAVSKYTDMLIPLISNAMLSLLLAYFLWHFGLWSAGDAKLFFVFSFLIPVNYYNYTYFSFFPAVALLVNIFVPASLFLTFVIISYFFRNARAKNFNVVEKIKDAAKKKNEYFSAFTGYFMVFLLVQFLVGKLQEVLKLSLGKNAFILYLFIFFLIYRPLFAQFKKKEFIKIALSFLMLIVMYGLIFSKTSIFPQVISTLKMAVIFMVISSVMLNLLQFYIDKVEVTSIKTKNLRMGSLLTENAITLLQEKCAIEKYYPDGLTSEDVRKIKSACDADEELQVYKTIPYAPIAFLGVVLTLTFKTSVLHLVLALIKNP